ncbi:CIC11C00000005110 [Sungouiella intermedia]|uniref:CIC11C00000005110 n=1 Tax=Sungouiella intermedia TaxID=45354 RepID=A0A1L0DCW2_9ASCO|nr:CIC11C00000005110 [[Candida] intermedia]
MYSEWSKSNYTMLGTRLKGINSNAKKSTDTRRVRDTKTREKLPRALKVAHRSQKMPSQSTPTTAAKVIFALRLRISHNWRRNSWRHFLNMEQIKTASNVQSQFRTPRC